MGKRKEKKKLCVICREPVKERYPIFRNGRPIHRKCHGDMEKLLGKSIKVTRKR